MAKQSKGVAIRIVGSWEDISSILAAFTSKGFAWKSNKHFYPRIGQQGFFSYYLENFKNEQESAANTKHKCLADEQIK
jgi:hypothetical protein